jgi:hypothetical protein
MRETELEKKLRVSIEKKGGQAYKFVSPGNSGVPDRLILFNKQAIFVETKAPGKKLKPLQEKRKREIEAQGFKVYKIDTKEKVASFISEVTGE